MCENVKVRLRVLCNQENDILQCESALTLRLLFIPITTVIVLVIYLTCMIKICLIHF